jgi:transcriptional regulator with XRE-family HTH domain
MDLIKIGKYIAFKRKEQDLTQKQLAEKLNMSDKSVSKWERGICLPDVSVYLELCKILGISINEFLAGEDIPKETIEQKAEENIIQITKELETNKKIKNDYTCILSIKFK